jgi:1-deoxy-D-xylulose-5-phosphate synthase
LGGKNVVPYMCIYSTFLTRALDQIVHDVSLMNLPVRFVIDRAGIVGPDGETHQGLSDLGYLCSLPYMSIFVPSNAQDIIDSMFFMETYNEGPIAIRFPKGSEDKEHFSYENLKPIEFGKSRIEKTGSELTIIAIGSFLDLAHKTASELETYGITSTIIDLRWVRPLDVDLLNSEISKTKKFIILDESYIDCGVSGYILNRISTDILSKYIKTYALPPEVIVHGERNEILNKYGITSTKIVTEVLGFFKKEKPKNKKSIPIEKNKLSKVKRRK